MHHQVLAYCKSPMMVEGVRDKVFIQLVKLNAAELAAENEEENDESEDDDDQSGEFEENLLLFFLNQIVAFAIGWVAVVTL